MTRKRPPTPAPISLQGDLDLFSIQAQWEALGPRLEGHEGSISLDLSGVGDLDLSGIQLLLALDRQARTKGGALALSGLRPEWHERFSLLGFGALLSGDR